MRASPQQVPYKCCTFMLPYNSSILAVQAEAILQRLTHLPRSPPGPRTLLSTEPSGQAKGSSRLRSSPSRMDEDLSEFKEKASVSASCTCRERWQPQVTHGAGSPRQTQSRSERSRDLLSMDGMPSPGKGPSLGWGVEGAVVSQSAKCQGQGRRVAMGHELQSWSTCPQTKCPCPLWAKFVGQVSARSWALPSGWPTSRCQPYLLLVVVTLPAASRRGVVVEDGTGQVVDDGQLPIQGVLDD